ncbi:MAG: hypothetical protein U5L01_08025 [Rheinheimera sp.]|nr:hypothetical protein [Rheinheimera sp.]
MQSKIRLLLAFTCALWLVPSIAAPLRVVMEVSPPHQTNEQGVPGGLTTAVVSKMLACSFNLER